MDSRQWPPVKDELPDDEEFLVDADEDAYRPRPQLPQSNVLMRNLAQLIKQLDDGVIDVDPDYQREVVWTADRMTGLVDSLMENFYIPPIILNDKTPPGAKKQLLVCVDGKQRLSSVLAFVKGIVPCHDHLGEKWWFCDSPSSRRKKILPAQARKQFLSKEFASFEFKDLSPIQEEDLFARVQMGVQLNLAERMRASTGPWQELAKLFVEDFPEVYNLMKDRARSKDFQRTLSCFSQILEVMHPNTSNGIPTLKTNHTFLPKLLKNKDAVDDGLKSHLASVWHTFKDLIADDPNTFTNDNKYLRGVQTFAPVEMVAITVMISMYSETRNNRLLLGDIQALRLALRENFIDLRQNTPVWRFIWEFLDDLEAIRGAVEGTTMDRVRSAPQTTGQGPLVSTAAPSTASVIRAAMGKKRGRPSGTTKKPAAVPDTAVAVKQEPVTSTPSSRPPKKQRTNPKVVNTAPAVTQQENNTQFPSSSATYTPFVEHTSSLPELPPFPIRTSRSPTQSGVDSRVTSPISTAPMHAVPPLHNMHHDRPVSTSVVPTPFEARQSRITELDSYRAPPAPMSRSMLSPTQDAKPAIPVGSSQPSQSSRAHFPPQQSSTPARPPSFRNTRPSPTQPVSSTSRPSALLHTAGVIDLTSDDEQERQSLLSSFKR